MRVLSFVLLAATLLLLPARSASAAKELYFLGGLVVANLGGDASTIGEGLAAELDSDPGGTWTSSKGTRTGFDVGAGLSFSKSSPWGGAVEVHYVKRGVNWKLDEVSGAGFPQVKTGLDLGYIEFPLLVQFSPATQSNIHTVLQAGPVIGLKSSANLKVEVSGQSTSLGFSDAIKGSYVAGMLGAGVKIRAATKSSVLLQARFQYGFTNVIDDPVLSASPQDFSFLAGYSVGL